LGRLGSLRVLWLPTRFPVDLIQTPIATWTVEEADLPR
jgi:hypothetical protein